MNFEEWLNLENAALKVIEDFGVAGIRVEAGEMSSVQRVAALREKARAMDARPDDPVLEPDDERRAVQLSGDGADDEDEDMEQLRALVRRYRRRSRSAARDARPQSDLDFYTRCAAECTRLS